MSLASVPPGGRAAFGRSRSVLVVTVLFLWAALGCDEETSSRDGAAPDAPTRSPPGDPFVEPAPGLRFPEALVGFRGVEVRPDSLVFDLADPDAFEVAAGDLVVGATDPGYLRRVTAVESMIDGRLVLRTTQATLAEAVRRGRLVIRANDQTVAAADPSSAEAGGTRAPLISLDTFDLNQTIPGTDDLVTVQATGSLQVTAPEDLFDLEVEIEGFAVERFAAVVDGEAMVDFGLAVQLGGTAMDSGELPLEAGGVPFLVTVPTPIGIPFPIRGRIIPVVTLKYESEVTAEGTLSVAGQARAALRAAAIYEDGEWRDEVSRTFAFSVGEPEWNVESDVRLRGAYEIALRVELYGVVGPVFAFERGLELSGTLRPCPPRYELAEDEKVSARIEAEIDIDIFSIEESFEYEIASRTTRRILRMGQRDSSDCMDAGVEMDGGSDERDAGPRDAGVRDAAAACDAGPDYMCPAPVCPSTEDAGTVAECSSGTSCQCPVGLGCFTVPYRRICCAYRLGSCSGQTCGAGYVTMEGNILDPYTGIVRTACTCSRGYYFGPDPLPADACDLAPQPI